MHHTIAGELPLLEDSLDEPSKFFKFCPHSQRGQDLALVPAFHSWHCLVFVGPLDSPGKDAAISCLLMEIGNVLVERVSCFKLASVEG